jgi:ABC-type bacteriocin/lantibiotic exporter with double-glycine peptidase domain
VLLLHATTTRRLLICDEATSALDSGTEAAIMSSLTDLAKGRTSIFVAHRSGVSPATILLPACLAPDERQQLAHSD